MARLEPKYPRVVALHDRVAALPRIAAYLASDRRIPFNEDGIFRHYPELDSAAQPKGAGHGHSYRRAASAIAAGRPQLFIDGERVRT